MTFRPMDKKNHSTSGARKTLRHLLLISLALLPPNLHATTLILPPAALPDMETMSSQRFKLRWPQTEIPDGNYPIEKGHWVTYQHGNLTYFIGPYTNQQTSTEGRTIFERIRNQLIAADPKFASSKIGILELNIDLKNLKQSSGPTPGQIPTTLDGKLELPPDAANPAVRSVQTNQSPSQAKSSPPSQDPPAHNPPGEFTENGGGQVFAGEGQYASVSPAFPPFLGHPLPPSHDLSIHFPPAGIQGKQNSCTGWTIAYALKSYHERLEEKWELVSLFGSSQKRHVFSPAYIYNQINGGKDEGAALIDALAMANTNGICSYVMMPYKPNNHTTTPSPMAHDHAKRFKIDFFSRVNIQDLTDLKAYLNAGFPIAVGITADPTFEHLKKNQIWKNLDEKKATGHALIALGYNDQKKAVRVYNSWGTRWANNGLGWIAYDHWTNIVKEAYITKDAPNDRHYTPPKRNTFKIALNQATLSPTQHGELTFTGHATVPPAYRGNLTIEIQLQDHTQKKLPGHIPSYQTIHGQAAALSPPIPLPHPDTNITWQVTMPMTNLPTPTPTNMTASATLFIDNFGLIKSKQTPVTKNKT